MLLILVKRGIVAVVLETEEADEMIVDGEQTSQGDIKASIYFLNSSYPRNVTSKQASRTVAVILIIASTALVIDHREQTSPLFRGLERFVNFECTIQRDMVPQARRSRYE